MRRISLILVVFVAVVSCSPVGKKNRTKYIFELGTTKLQEGYYDQAIELFSKAIEMEPSLTDAYMNRGVAFFESGSYVMALADYNEVYKQRPDFHDILFNRAYAYLELGRYPLAMEDIVELRKIYPDTALLDMVEGLVWEKQDKYEDAILSFSKAIEKNPEYFDAWANRGTTYFHKKDFESAENDLLRALEIHQNEPYILNSLSLVLAHKGELEKADSLIDVAMGMVAQQPYFINNKGFIQMKLGNYSLADSLIRKSLSIDPENEWAMKNLDELSSLSSD